MLYPVIDLLFTSREGLVVDVVVGGCLGYNDHEIIVFNMWSNKEGHQQNFYTGLLENSSPVLL